MSRNINLVSLFTGAGGLDYGFDLSGFRISVCVEMDKDCCKTIENSRNWPMIHKDIHKTTTKEILETGNLNKGDVDVIVGGPPCQPFSKSGYWTNGDTKRLKDPRSNTLSEFMRCVDEMEPEVFLIENVHGIKYSGKEEGFNFLCKKTKEINSRRGTKYTLSWSVLNSVEYGIPQIRQRFFLIGHREGKKFNFPKPTHTKNKNDYLENSSLNRAATAWDAIGNMKEPQGKDLTVKGKWADLLPSIPEGENYLWHTNRKNGVPLFGWRTRFWTFLLKLAKNMPSWTIQAQPGPSVGPFHWNNRKLSIKELANIQTFPKNVFFYGNRNSIQKQVGNAVPSLLSEVLAREIAEQFFGVSYNKPPKLSVELKKKIPPPETTKTVPKKYLDMFKIEPKISSIQIPIKVRI